MKKDGGAAFPRPAGWNGLNSIDEHSGNDAEEGMSLRDYFAAKAMHAELNTAGALEGPRDALVEAATKAGRSVEDQIAFNSYELADAMLRGRGRG